MLRFVEPKDSLFETACELTRRRYAKQYLDSQEKQARRNLNINMTIEAKPSDCIFSIDGEGEKDVCLLADGENNICPYFDKHECNCLCPLDSGNILIRRTNDPKKTNSVF